MRLRRYRRSPTITPNQVDSKGRQKDAHAAFMQEGPSQGPAGQLIWGEAEELFGNMAYRSSCLLFDRQADRRDGMNGSPAQIRISHSLKNWAYVSQIKIEVLPIWQIKD